MKKVVTVLSLILVIVGSLLLVGCSHDNECGACNGTGYYQKKKCPICKGSGNSDYDPYEQYKNIGK